MAKYIDQQHYKKLFEDKEKCKEALWVALQNRNLEIELYWKRAAYFWTLSAAALAGYIALKEKSAGFDICKAIPLWDKNIIDTDMLSVLICCIGLVFSFAWYLANKGSKQWQENWEHHVDLLEDEVIGPLFKVVLGRDQKKQQPIIRNIVDPGGYSVSKINNFLSFFVVFIWAAILVAELFVALHQSEAFSLEKSIYCADMVVRIKWDKLPYILLAFGFVSVAACRCLFSGCRTAIEPARKMLARQREAEIRNKYAYLNKC